MDGSLWQFTANFVERTTTEPLLAISEGLVKVRAIESALCLGWVAQEGAGWAAARPVADYLRLEQGEVVCDRGPRRVSLQEGSCDVTVVQPVKFMLEIKARPDIGTKSQAQFQEMWEDLKRVAGDPRVAFLFAFDQKIYRSFSGERTERRGRRADVSSRWFADTFPQIQRVKDESPLLVAGNVGDVAISLCFWCQRVSANTCRVVALGASGDMIL